MKLELRFDPLFDKIIRGGGERECPIFRKRLRRLPGMAHPKGDSSNPLGEDAHDNK